MTDILIDARRGAGSSLEILYGTVTWKPTLTHSRGTSVVLPAPTTYDLVDGQVVATNVQPTPAPVGGQIEWAYEVTFKDRHGKTFSFLVGVPDSTTQVNFISLPRYFETKPPLFGQGPKGDPGESATVAVGSVTEGSTAQVNNSGTNTDAVLDFVLPQGPQGPKGDGVNYISATTAEVLPTVYPNGLSYFFIGSNTGTGWPISFASVWTYKTQSAARTSQRIISHNGEGTWQRIGTTGSVWGAFERLATTAVATTTANGLMSSADKSKLDNIGILGYNSKRGTDAPSTYPVGTTVLRASQSNVWPGESGVSSDLVTVVTSKSSNVNGGVSQWLYEYNAPTVAPKYRISRGDDTWGEWNTNASQEWVSSNQDYLTPEQFGAVGDNVVDDQVALQQAISLSVSTGKPLYLANVYYTSTLSSVFWSASYEGTGGVRVGSNTTSHRPNPSNNGVSFPVYYDSNNGNDANSGLAPEAPMKTMATFVARFTIFMGKRQGNLGAYKLVVANGTHNDKFRSTGMFPAMSARFWLEGESRAGAIIDGTGTSNDIGVWVEPGSYFGVRNITIQNFMSPDTSGGDAPDNGAGIVHKGGGDVRVENTTVQGCSQGIGIINESVGAVNNCLVENCQTGVRVLYGSSAIVSYSTLRNCSTHGVFVSRNAVTHVDYNTIEGCGVGVAVNMAARNATLGGTFRSNDIGVTATGAGELIISEATEFISNTRDRAYYGVGRETRIHGNAPTTNEWCLHKTAEGKFHSGTTANTTIYSPGSNTFVYPRHHTTQNSKLRVKLYGSTAGPGTKTLRFYSLNPANSSEINLLGSAVIDASSTGEFQLDIENWGITQYGNHGRSKLEVSGKTPVMFSGSNTAVTTYKWIFRVMAQNSDTAGSVSLQVAELYLMG